MMKGFKGKRQALLSLALSGALMCAIAVSAQGQEVTASIVGKINDASGAVIPGTTVTISNVRTNIARKITTDANGYYSFPLVKPATYSVIASKPGFATGVHGDVILSISTGGLRRR